MARPPRCAWHAYRHQPSRRWGTYTSRLHGRSKAVMVRPHSITVSGAGRHQSDYAISLGIDSRPYAGVCRLASRRSSSRGVGHSSPSHSINLLCSPSLSIAAYARPLDVAQRLPITAVD